MPKSSAKGKAGSLGLKVESIKKLNDADAANVKGGALNMPTGHTTAPTVGDIRMTGTSVIQPIGNIGVVKP
jgi:hypothetical protein